MDTYESECPLCLCRMQVDEHNDTAWLSCPNGCPTEFEVAVRKPAEMELQPQPVLIARAAGS